MADAKLEIILQAKDQTKGAFSSVKSELAGIGTATQKAGSSLSSMSKVMTTAAVAGAAVLATGFVAVVKQASSFESAMSAVKAASGASASEMAQLSDKALDLGSDVELAGIGATDAATAMAELAKGGVSVADQLGGATKGALLLASAGNIDVAEAAALATKAMNIFGLSGADVAHVADLMAAGANKSATDVGQLGAAFNQSAAVADNAGLSIEELTGTLAFLAQRGMEGSDAGTSLKTALLALQAPTDVAATTMKELGINVRDAQGKMLPFAEIAQILQDKLGGLSDAQRDAALKTIFGNDAIRVGIALYEGGGNAIKDWTAKVDDAGSAADTGRILNDNLAGSFNQLVATIQTGAIKIGEKFIPVLRTLTDEGTKFIDSFLKSPDVQRGIDRLAKDATEALTKIIDKLKDPAFQQSMKDWATAALDVGRAVVDLAGTVKDVLGPPLVAAVGWFNDLDEGGKKNVVTFGLLTVAAIKLVGPLTTLVTTLGQLFTIATKVGGALAIVAKTPAALAVADLAAVTAGALVVTYGLVEGSAKLANAMDQEGKRAQELITTREAMAFAAEHGATATNKHAEAFNAWLLRSNLVIKNSNDLANAWNQYINRTSMAGESTAGLTLALNGQAQAQLKVNQVLGEGLVAGNQFNDTINVQAGAARSLSSAIEATAAAQQAAIDAQVRYTLALQDTNGVLTPFEEQTRLANLHVVELGVALQAAEGRVQAAGMALAIAEQDTGEFGTAVGLARNQVLGLTTAFNEHQSALAGLNGENGRLGGYLQTLQAEWDALNVATENGKHITKEQAAEYARLSPAIQYLNSVMGENKKGIVDNTLALVELDGKLKNAGVSLGTASDIAVTTYAKALASGKTETEALSLAIQAAGGNADTATGKIGGISSALGKLQFGVATLSAEKFKIAIDKIPGTATVNVTTPGLAAATDNVNGLTNAINLVPKTFTVTATVDISGALSEINRLNNNMPHSPAKEGPFQTLPNWNALFESWGPALDSAIKAFEGWGNDIAKKGAETVSSVSKAITDALGATSALSKVDTSAGPTGEQLGWFAHLADSLLSTLRDVASRFDGEGLKLTGEIADTLGKMGGGVKGALDGLGALAQYDFTKGSPTGEALGWFAHLTESLILTLQNVATMAGTEALDAAKRVGESMGQVGSAVKSTLEGFQALSDYDFTKGSPTGDAMGWFTHLMQSIVLNFAGAAQMVGTEGMAQAQAFAKSVSDVVAAGTAGLKLFEELLKSKDIPADVLRTLWDALEGALSAMGDLVSRSDALKNAAFDYLANMEAAALAVLKAQSLGNGMGSAPLVVAPAGIGGGGFDTGKASGGVSNVTLNMYGDNFDTSSFEDRVVATLETATRKGRN